MIVEVIEMEKAKSIKRVRLKETWLKMANEKKIEIENEERSRLSVSLSNEILPPNESALYNI